VRWVVGECVAEEGKVPARFPCSIKGGGGPPVLGLTLIEPSGEGRFGGERLEGVVEDTLQALG
jgi:hypothetical protein